MAFDLHKISKITNNLDFKRIPLNEQQRKLKESKRLYPYIGANNILGYIDDYIFDEKILCVAEDGGSWGANEKCAFIVDERCWVNNHAHVLTAKDNLHLEYLCYYLNFTNLNKFITGSTRGKLTKTSLNSIEIPLPPLPEQQRIAAILDAADTLRKKTQQLIDSYDELAQSVFLDMFGDPVKNERGFELVTVRDMVSDVKYGTSAKAGEKGQYPYLRMNNISYQGYMDYSDLKYIDVSPDEKEKYLVRKGDIVFNRTNSKELVGKTGIITSNKEMIIAGYLIRIRVNEYANPYYLWAHLNSKWAKGTLMNMCKNIVGMANINAQEMQNIRILKAPILLQTQFAQKIELIEKQKELAKQSLRESEDLFQSLLQKAFKGALGH